MFHGFGHQRLLPWFLGAVMIGGGAPAWSREAGENDAILLP